MSQEKSVVLAAMAVQKDSAQQKRQYESVNIFFLAEGVLST
jgi:hypothetical protein